MSHARLLAAVLMLGCLAAPAAAQVYQPYFPSPMFQGGGTMYPLDGFVTDFGAVNFGAVGFGAVDFGAVNFGAVNFGAVDFLPVNGYGYGAYDGYYPAAMMSPYGLGQAAYNVGSMKESTASAASAAIGQRSLQSVLANAPPNTGAASPRYNIRSPRSRRSSGPRLVDLTARDGSVIWPPEAPTDGDLASRKAAADVSIKRVVSSFRISGKASVDQVSAAIRHLVEYANPAMQQLRRDNPSAVFAFRDFVVNLDRGLRNLAGKSPIDAPDIDPVRAPGG